MKRVAILGGGISGLSTAYALLKKEKISVTLYEKSPRVGGWIETTAPNGFLFEKGPRAFRSSGKGVATLQLVKELGLENELILASPHAQKRYLLYQGRLQEHNFPFLFRHGLLKAYFLDRKVPFSEKEESIGDFFCKRVGKELTELVVDPVISGIFGGSLWDLSFQASFPLLYEEVVKRGTFFRALRARKAKALLYSFRNGMESLTCKLYEVLREKIAFGSSENDFDHVISSVPLRDQFPYLTLTLVHCGWNHTLPIKKGFGYLVPSSEKEEILGCTFDSLVFPEHNKGEQTRLTFMMRGEKKNAEKIVLDCLRRHLGIKSAPDLMLTSIAKEAIPQYVLGHQKKIALLDQPHTTFTGNLIHGIGVNDCIAGSKLTAEKVLTALQCQQRHQKPKACEGDA